MIISNTPVTLKQEFTGVLLHIPRQEFCALISVFSKAHYVLNNLDLL